MSDETLALLLIEDDPDMRALIRTFLARELPRAELTEVDPQVATLPTTEEALESFDCVLVNYDLGSEESGLDWMREVRRSNNAPAVILLTGADDAYVATRAMKLGAEDYLNKRDLTARRLAEIISTTTANRSAERGQGDGHKHYRPSALAPGNRTPTQLKGYVLGQMIGKGASAQVFLAERAKDGLTVVIKLLRSHIMDVSEVRVERFMREARLVASLKSRQIVRIYEQAFTDDVGFIAMEYLPGGDLRQRIAAGIAPKDALRCFREVLMGLEAIHAVGVIHRDLKPGNVMFRRDGSLALADFGLSKRTDSSTDLTMSGQIMGTPAYMSPEQGQGEPATELSDIYSAGVMFFEMLCGAKPYEAASVTGVIYKHIMAPIPKLPEYCAEFQPIIDAVMSKLPADRPPSAAHVLQMTNAYCA